MTTTSTPASAARSLSVLLWIVQVLLAAAFGMAGVMKTTMPIDALVTSVRWAGDVPPMLVRFIGGCEFLGALGLLLPALTRVQPMLTPLAAAGLATVMGLAMAFHATRGEWQALPINLTLGGLAAFVAWGRSRKAPIRPR